ELLLGRRGVTAGERVQPDRNARLAELRIDAQRLLVLSLGFVGAAATLVHHADHVDGFGELVASSFKLAGNLVAVRVVPALRLVRLERLDRVGVDGLSFGSDGLLALAFAAAARSLRTGGRARRAHFAGGLAAAATPAASSCESQRRQREQTRAE